MSSPPSEGTRVTLPPRESAATSTEVSSHPAPAPDATTSTTTTAAEPEEDLLRDVLDELDKERSKRAQAEADFRHMAQEREVLEQQLLEERQKNQRQQQQQQQAQKQQSTEQAISRQAFIAMEAQVKGYQQLVDALTLGKPAIAAAAQQSAILSSSRTMPSSYRPKTLPLHVVRLLEVLPWAPAAQEHVFGRETIYEWQVYDSREAKWHSHLRHFPNRLKQLPISKPRPEPEVEAEGDRSLLNFLAGGDKAAWQTPSKHGVLTDTKLSQILKIEAGYPLPQDGGRWEWVGGWRIEKRVKDTKTHAATAGSAVEKKRVDCDDDGWSYGIQVEDFVDLPTELVWDNPGSDMSRKIRRRQWSRQRVLVDYPFCSERTKHYLKLLAENARLTITATKISDQLVETKTKLTETEEALMELKSTKQAEVALATTSTHSTSNDDLIKTSSSSPTASAGGGGPPGKRIQEFLQKNDQVKEIGSKISQWVARKTSEDFVSNDSLDELGPDGIPARQRSGSDQATLSSTGSVDSGHNPNTFNWRKVGRGGLIEKLAGKKNVGRSGSLGEDRFAEGEEDLSLKEESAHSGKW